LKEAKGEKERGTFTVRSVQEWMREILPDLRVKKIVFEVVQYPGG
jgi:hypothetical protein